MALSVIAGPPNSGRTGAILEAFRAALARDPILVVPTADDVERFEEELTRDGAPLVGARVCTFDRLFTLVAGALGVPARPPLSRVQRRRLAAEAASRVDLVRLAASARQPDFRILWNNSIFHRHAYHRSIPIASSSVATGRSVASFHSSLARPPARPSRGRAGS